MYSKCQVIYIGIFFHRLIAPTPVIVAKGNKNICLISWYMKLGPRDSLSAKRQISCGTPAEGGYVYYNHLVGYSLITFPLLNKYLLLVPLYSIECPKLR